VDLKPFVVRHTSSIGTPVAAFVGHEHEYEYEDEYVHE
jgi:hypothetical protein